MTDREDTIKTSLIGEAALMMARLWKQHLRPVKYDRVFYLDNIRVQVSIDEFRSPDDTRPMGAAEQMSDRSADV